MAPQSANPDDLPEDSWFAPDRRTRAVPTPRENFESKPLRLPNRPHIRGMHCGTPHASYVRRLAAIRGSSAEVMRELDAGGMAYPSAFVRTSCANLDRAIEAVAVLADRERPASMILDEGAVEHLTLADGRGTGVHSRIADCGRVSERGFFDERTGFTAARHADARSTVIDLPDLGWDLVSCDAARTFAAGDIAAAVMVRALSGVTWIHTASRVRWQASGQMAELVVRLLRSGRPAPGLVTPPGRIAADAAVVDLIARIHWHPLPTVSSYNIGESDAAAPAEERGRPTWQ